MRHLYENNRVYKASKQHRGVGVSTGTKRFGGCLFATAYSFCRLLWLLVLLAAHGFVYVLMKLRSLYKGAAVSSRVPFVEVVLLSAFIALLVGGGILNITTHGIGQVSKPQPSLFQRSTPTNTPAVAGVAGVPGTSPRLPDNNSLVEARVIRVIDGDTIVVQAVDSPGEAGSLRLIGMDTPETVHPRKPVMCYGAEATAKTQRLIDEVGGRVFLERDVSERDMYRRLLRYVWLPQAGGGMKMLNEELVRDRLKTKV